VRNRVDLGAAGPGEARVADQIELAGLGCEPQRQRRGQRIGQRRLMPLARHIRLALVEPLHRQPARLGQEEREGRVPRLVWPLAKRDGRIVERRQRQIDGHQNE
jgi:hypothetical protein